MNEEQYKYIIYCEVSNSNKILVKFFTRECIKDQLICECINIGFVTNKLRKNKGDGMIVYKFQINFKLKNIIKKWIYLNICDDIDFRFMDIIFLEKEYEYCTPIHSEIYIKKVE